ncbi:hypothetical protein R1flu_000889 [Riccia fluitans]|uniref:GDSL esterase/lipase n=1 Tax=Riccia fluitans TaxID=41844 RepID=A0ABD1Y1P5_9MARC
MTTFWIFYLLCLQTTLRFVTIHSQSDEHNPRLLFVFGDSYADTGNIPFPNATAWHVPYGMSWPGSPSGRFSDGFVETDFLASALGIPSPTQYARVLDNVTISGGVNFAVGGSGVTYAFGTPSFQTQVGWFKKLVKEGRFTEESLTRALFFVSVSGNDYGAYNGTTLEGFFPLARKVPRLIDLTLRRLYSLGARNFIIVSLPPFLCLPSNTVISDYRECDKNETLREVVKDHNHHLGNRLKNMTRNLEQSNVLYLQQTRAMLYILHHLSEFNLTEGLKPCCVGTCSSFDVNGNPLFTVCDTPGEHFFWDAVHPSQAGWRAVVKLYTRSTRFTGFVWTLAEWVDSLRS